MLNEEFDYQVQEYAVRPLRPQDLPDLQALIERSADYTWMLTGGPPGPADAEELFSDRPPDAGPEDKILLGVRAANNKLVGVLDAIRNYPQPDSWFLGLLMIEPAHRGHGLGRAIYQALKRGRLPRTSKTFSWVWSRRTGKGCASGAAWASRKPSAGPDASSPAKPIQ